MSRLAKALRDRELAKQARKRADQKLQEAIREIREELNDGRIHLVGNEAWFLDRGSITRMEIAL